MINTLKARAGELSSSLAAPVGTYFAVKEWVADRALTVSAQFGDVVLLADRTFTLEWVTAAAAFLIANRFGGEVDRQRLRNLGEAADFANARLR